MAVDDVAGGGQGERAERVGVHAAGVAFEQPGAELGLDPAEQPGQRGLAGAVFLVYPVGTLSSALSGRQADRYGRRAVMPLGCVLTAAGLLLTLADRLPLAVTGLAVMTAGFFCVHGVASGWVPVRAHAGDVPPAQAASLYLFAYYAGSSVFGSLAGAAWTWGAWPAVVALASVIVAISGVLSVRLRHVPALTPIRT